MNNGYDMVVRPETAAQYKLETLSDLAKVSKELKLGAGPEFRDRKDGLPGLKAKYGMEFKEDLQLAIGLRYQALANKQIDVVNGYSTDGMISAMKLKRLKDDKGLWPPYYLVPGRAQGRARRESEDRRRPEPGQRAADRGEHGRDELQGRRREDGAEGRRARLPEVQGRRQVEPAERPRRPAMRAVTLRRSARVGDRATSSPSRAMARRSTLRPASSHASSARARSSSAPPTGDTPIYGLNSALGANTGAPLAADEQRRYQVRAVRARAVGVGPPLPDDRVRAAMFARVAGMAQGGSGVSVAGLPGARRRAESRPRARTSRPAARSASPTCRSCRTSRSR